MAVSICGLFNYGYLYVEISTENVIVSFYLSDLDFKVELDYKIEGY